jgi:hypothetical protein
MLKLPCAGKVGREAADIGADSRGAGSELIGFEIGHQSVCGQVWLIYVFTRRTKRGMDARCLCAGVNCRASARDCYHSPRQPRTQALSRSSEPDPARSACRSCSRSRPCNCSRSRPCNPGCSWRQLIMAPAFVDWTLRGSRQAVVHRLTLHGVLTRIASRRSAFNSRSINICSLSVAYATHNKQM